MPSHHLLVRLSDEAFNATESRGSEVLSFAAGAGVITIPQFSMKIYGACCDIRRAWNCAMQATIGLTFSFKTVRVGEPMLMVMPRHERRSCHARSTKEDRSPTSTF